MAVGTTNDAGNCFACDTTFFISSCNAQGVWNARLRTGATINFACMPHAVIYFSRGTTVICVMVVEEEYGEAGIITSSAPSPDPPCGRTQPLCAG